MRILSYILFAAAIVASCWFGWKLYDQSQQLNVVKADFARINEIKYGLFNLERWKSGLVQIFEDRIGEFEIGDSNFESIQVEVEKLLANLYEEYFVSGDILDTLLDPEGEKDGMVNQLFMGMLKKNIGKQLADLDFKANIPLVAEKLVEELKKKSPELKKAFTDQIKTIVDAGAASVLEDERVSIYNKYEMNSLEDSNEVLKEQISAGNEYQKKLIQYVLLCLIGSVILALLTRRFVKFREFILMLTASSLVFLGLGVSLPMIDLDARLNKIEFQIFGSDISFEEQILYYQSKSIIDVTETLLKGHGFDLKLVGVLILLFSIVFPFTKLIVSTVFLYVEKARNSKVMEAIIYYLGKWSMADVFTVAIFMSYIGFYGLLNTQLSEISADSNSYAIDTVNYSKLSPGFIFFTAYCIISIIISIIIQKNQKTIVTEVT